MPARRSGCSHAVVPVGGFGGLSTVQALRKVPVDVTAIDQRNHHLFQPLPCQVATAGLSPHGLARKNPGPFRHGHYGNLAALGRRKAIIEFGRLHLHGFVAWALWSVAHIFL